jgi:geranyl-CoA carboxylase alpha subunit
MLLECAGRPFALELEPTRPNAELIVHGAGATVRIAPAPRADALVLDGVRCPVPHVFDGYRVWLALDGVYELHDVTHREREPERTAGSGRAIAPMDGAVVDVSVASGQRVERGQTLVVVEAMKLELKVIADVAGVVAAVHAARGDQVKARQLLVELSTERETQDVDR